MQDRECVNHYFCLCGHFNDYRQCHYCRKKKTFYKEHYICLNCCIGWKSKHELLLKPSVESGSQLHVVKSLHENENYQGPRCAGCNTYPIEVGRDFRLPKRSNKKAWNELRKERDTFADNGDFSRHMIKKYTYACDGSLRPSKPHLYVTRVKKPWTIKK